MINLVGRVSNPKIQAAKGGRGKGRGEGGREKGRGEGGKGGGGGGRGSRRQEVGRRKDGGEEEEEGWERRSEEGRRGIRSTVTLECQSKGSHTVELTVHCAHLNYLPLRG